MSRSGRNRRSETEKSRWVDFILRLFFVILAALLIVGAALVFAILNWDSIVKKPMGQTPDEETVGAELVENQNQEAQEGYETQSGNEAEQEQRPETEPVYIKHDGPLDEIISEWVQAEGFDVDDISFVIEDLETGEKYERNADEYYIAASTYKLPLAMLWMDKVNAGEVSLDDTLPYLSYMYEDGGPIGWNYSIGSYIDIKTIIEYTLRDSDNSGGHILWEGLGGWVQYKKDVVKYCDIPQSDKFFSYDNIYSAEFMNGVLKVLYENQEDYKFILDLMKISEPENWLNSVLHELAYQKYGNYDWFGNSVGLVLDGHPYSIAVYTRYGGYALYVLGHVNAICYEYFNGYLPE